MSRSHTSDGSRITGQGDRDCPPYMKKGTHQLQPIHYRLPVASAQVKSALILRLYRLRVNRRLSRRKRRVTIRRIRIRQFGGDPSGWKNHPHPRWTRVPRSNSHRSWRYFQCSLWLVAGPILPESVIKIENVGINQTRTGNSRVI